MKTLFEQGLQHFLILLPCYGDSWRRRRLDVEAVVGDPARAARQLKILNSIGLDNDLANRHPVGRETPALPAPDHDPGGELGGVAGFDGRCIVGELGLRRGKPA